MNKLSKILLMSTLLSSCLFVSSCAEEKYTLYTGYYASFSEYSAFSDNSLSVDAVSYVTDSRGIIKDIKFDTMKFTLGVNVKIDWTFEYRPTGITLVNKVPQSYLQLGKLDIVNPSSKERFDKDLDKYASFCKRKTIEEIFTFKNQISSLAGISIDVTNYNLALENSLDRPSSSFKGSEEVKTSLSMVGDFKSSEEGIFANVIINSLLINQNKIINSFTDEIVYQVEEALIENGKVVLNKKANQVYIHEDKLTSVFDLVNKCDINNSLLTSKIDELNQFDKLLKGQDSQTIKELHLELTKYNFDTLINMIINSLTFEY